MTEGNSAQILLHRIAAVIFAGITTLGTTALGIGIYYGSLTNYRRITGTFAVPYTTLVWSIVTIGITIMAQVAMKRPSRGLLGMTILLTGLTAAGIGLTTAAHIIQQDTLDEVVATNMRTEILRANNTRGYTQLDDIQIALGCCGSSGFEVYATMDMYKHGSVPVSCCINQTYKTGCNQPPLEGKINTRGCEEPLLQIMLAATRHCIIALGLLGVAMTTVWTAFLVWFSLCMSTTQTM